MTESSNPRTKRKGRLRQPRRKEAMKRIRTLRDFIASQESEVTEFDEALVKKLIMKVTISTKHFAVEFKPGITIDLKA